MWSHQEACGYLVYLDTDMSRPRQQYRTEEHPDFGRKFVLASAPFLVKVFAFDRHREVSFTFRAHKHLGVGPWDAIQVPYGVAVPDAFPLAGQRLNDDWAETDWVDEDRKWFRLDSPQVPMGRDLQVMVEVVAVGVESGVSIVRENGARRVRPGNPVVRPRNVPGAGVATGGRDGVRAGPPPRRDGPRSA